VMHTAAAGRAQLGEEVGNAHDAVLLLKIQGPERPACGVLRGRWRAAARSAGQTSRRRAARGARCVVQWALCLAAGVVLSA
jgi:hypothetical protein